MKKTNKLLLLACFILFIASCVFVVLSIPKIYGYVTSPKIDGIRYSHTTYENLETRCIVADCPPLKHRYTATGSQKEIMERIIKDLNKDGYILEPDKDYSSWIMCEEYNPKVIDHYRLYKPDAYYKHPHTIDIDFETDTRYPTDESKPDVIGCERMKDTYRISVSTDKANCVASESTDTMCYEEGLW